MSAITKEVATVEEPSQAVSMVSVIERMASNPAVDVDKLERLLAMQERIVARDAETQFNVAMTAAQSEMTRVSADAVNPQTHSRYASYAQLDRALRPLYTRHGFSLSFDEADCPHPDMVRVVCRVSHISGHTRTYQADMPADGKGAKGGDVMTKTHAHGAAKQYGMRYLIKGIFNVAIGEKEADGNDSEPTLTEDQIANIQALLEETGADKAVFLKWCKVNAISEIYQRNYSTCVKTIEARRKR